MSSARVRNTIISVPYRVTGKSTKVQCQHLYILLRSVFLVCSFKQKDLQACWKQKPGAAKLKEDDAVVIT